MWINMWVLFLCVLALPSVAWNAVPILLFPTHTLPPLWCPAGTSLIAHVSTFTWFCSLVGPIHNFWAVAPTLAGPHPQLRPLTTDSPWELLRSAPGFWNMGPTPWTYLHGCAVFYFFLLLFRATPLAYGSSWARDWIRATAAGLCHSHSKVGSELHLWPTPQLGQRHWVRKGMEPTSSKILVGFLTCCATIGTPVFSFLTHRDSPGLLMKSSLLCSAPP